MKKFFSILLALSMIVCMMAGFAVSASAEQIIEGIAITGMPQIAYGDEITVEGIQVSEDAPYTLEAYWEYETPEEGFVQVESGTFTYGWYSLCLTVNIPEDYELVNPDWITIDGVHIFEIDNLEYFDFTEEAVYVRFYMILEPEIGYIGGVDVSGTPETLTVGEDLTVPTLEALQEEAQIISAAWLDADMAPAADKVEEGGVYYLAVQIAPAEGFAFDYWPDVGIDSNHSVRTERNMDGTITAYIRYSLLPTVDGVNVIVTEPVVGAAPAAPQVEDENMVIVEYNWYDVRTYEAPTQFEDGKKYGLGMTIEPPAGYEFAPDAELTINGEIAYGQDNAGTYVYLYEEYSFLETVERIDVTLPEPELGGVVDYEAITATGEGFTMEYAYWYCDTNPGDFEVFEKELYILETEFVAQEGYEFTSDTKAYVNGVEVESLWGEGDWAYCIVFYSLRDKLDTVALPALPELKAGDMITDVLIQAPEGADYTLDAQWFVYSSQTGIQSVEGPFEDGKIYALDLTVLPGAGYEFSEDAVVTIGGQAYQGDMLYVDSNYISIVKMLGVGLKVIDTIELTAVMPEDGKLPEALTVPEDAGYKLDLQAWGSAETDDHNDVQEMTEEETFVNGKYYWIAAVLVAEEGYMIAEDAKVTLNGEELAFDADNTIFLGDMCQIIASTGKLEEVPAKPDLPETGDDMLTVALIALVVLSAAGVMVSVASRKRYY